MLAKLNQASTEKLVIYRLSPAKEEKGVTVDCDPFYYFLNEICLACPKTGNNRALKKINNWNQNHCMHAFFCTAEQKQHLNTKLCLLCTIYLSSYFHSL
jgi:hypothetical protein